MHNLGVLQVTLADVSIKEPLTVQERLLKGVTRAEALEYKTGPAVVPKLEERDGQWYATVSVNGQ